MCTLLQSNLLCLLTKFATYQEDLSIDISANYLCSRAAELPDQSPFIFILTFITIKMF